MNRRESSVRTRKLAVSAMLSALGTVFLYIGSATNILDLTSVAIASLLIFFAVMEMGTPYQYLIYGVTSLLAVLLLPDKAAAVTYLLFGGIYPVFKAMFEKLHFVVAWILKFSYFNTVLTLIIAISKYVVHVDDPDIGFRIGLYALANLTFLLYDIATSQLVLLYLVKLRQRFRIVKFFGEQSNRKNAADIDKPDRKV